ncbi:PTB domain-containing engulfment adapter protein 1-like isoform X2 [Pecten maximus]|uniref:PTB domain-containing engulfment adapter protein 1-like isoform X2 n=1 Tax=Pecten maximus TaxID=6579 RepID=UPI0014591175|nr:PTB domain-containing engulfment adapter protein 1-like isoform X2 [Pecten maximus]
MVDTSTASIKVARDYFKSSQSTVLIPNRDFGKRKFIHVGINKQPSSSRLIGSSSEPPDIPSSPLSLLTTPTNPSSLGGNMRAANKQWVHPPETLLRGHIVYNVKFLGESEVENPKGTEVVKDAIRKRKFNKHIKKAEGQKPPKVELTISADGVTVQDPKTKMIMHQYALHRISYCADDKSDKRMFTFIAKAGDSNQHYCYVFDSEKCAEEITLTIGQAFDLAYRRFMETSSRDFDLKKQYLMLQKKVQGLEKENLTLRLRVQELERQQTTSDNLRNQQDSPSNGHTSPTISDENDKDVLNTSQGHSTILTLASSPPTDDSTTDDQNKSEAAKQTSVGRRLENLLIEESHIYSEPKTNGTNGTTAPSGGQGSGILSPPPPSSRSRTHSQPQPLPLTSPSQPTNSQAAGKDAFGATPFGTATAGGQTKEDPFGMPSFNPNSSMEIDQAIQSMDKFLLDVQEGFSQGLSMGSEDFSLADLDPLSQK